MSKPLTAFWWAPKHQPTEGVTAEFHLRPLNLWERMDLASDVYRNGGAPTSAGAAAVFASNVIGWREVGPEYSPAAKQEVINDAADDWMWWLFEICGHLLNQSRLTETERGN